MLSLYVPILILAALAAVFAGLSLVMGSLAGPKRWNRAKLQAYESGIEPTPQPRGGGRFPVKYYVTAMLFILFDIEIIFLYPGRSPSPASACSAGRDGAVHRHGAGRVRLRVAARRWTGLALNSN